MILVADITKYSLRVEVLFSSLYHLFNLLNFCSNSDNSEELAICSLGAALTLFNFCSFTLGLLINVRWSLLQSALVYALHCKPAFLTDRFYSRILPCQYTACLFLKPSDG